MVKLILFIAVIFLFVLGLCEFIYIFRMLFYFPNTRLNDYLIVVLTGGYALKELNYFWQKIKWHGDSLALGIIAITDNISNNELVACENFIKNKKIILCTSDTVVNCEQLKGS